MRMEAEARGIQEILTKQAQGYAQLVQSVGGDPANAAQMMIAEKLEKLMQIQVDAIKGIQIDKINVWDSMSDGSPTTANFLSGMLKSIPPMNEMFKMVGMEIPGYLGKDAQKTEAGDSNVAYDIKVEDSNNKAEQTV